MNQFIRQLLSMVPAFVLLGGSMLGAKYHCDAVVVIGLYGAMLALLCAMFYCLAMEVES